MPIIVGDGDVHLLSGFNICHCATDRDESNFRGAVRRHAVELEINRCLRVLDDRCDVFCDVAGDVLTGKGQLDIAIRKRRQVNIVDLVVAVIVKLSCCGNGCALFVTEFHFQRAVIANVRCCAVQVHILHLNCIKQGAAIKHGVIINRRKGVDNRCITGRNRVAVIIAGRDNCRHLTFRQGAQVSTR